MFSFCFFMLVNCVHLAPWVGGFIIFIMMGKFSVIVFSKLSLFRKTITHLLGLFKLLYHSLIYIFNYGSCQYFENSGAQLQSNQYYIVTSDILSPGIERKTLKIVPISSQMLPFFCPLVGICRITTIDPNPAFQD